MNHVLEKVAGAIFSREDGVTVEEGLRFILIGKGEDHFGDCTKESGSCSRCLYEKYMAEARVVVEFLRDPTAEQLGAGWQQLRRVGFPRLGPGPGLAEAYTAMIDQVLS